MKYSIIVTLKKDVLDPQGKVVENTLKNMGLNSLKSVRQGKYFEIEVEEKNEEVADKEVTQMFYQVYDYYYKFEKTFNDYE